ncbi:MAG: alanine--tRNA ligase [Candidatus Pacebacteria bacterium]|nr:alanine--tRNA ligase [Candidatus Paceibacterota bacterium]
MLTSSDIRQRFLDFFAKRGHAIIPSASLVTTDEPGATNATLFNTAGMQPFVPYLMGQLHPLGKRLVNAQKCVRTIDLDEVGDATHLTFFEMLGNWSLGDYFKEDAIKWSYEFLTSVEEGLGLDTSRLYFTVFSGSDAVEKDSQAAEIWKSLGVPEHRIYWKNSKSNWWTAGPNSPAGPSTEMFYDVTGTLGDLSQEEFEKHEDAQKIVEIWNDVFMAYRQENNVVVGELPQKNVDTGAGLERVTMVVQGKSNVYETDLFASVIETLKAHATNYSERSMRIVVDHVKASMFLISDGVFPANKDRGYVLRRLIRRAMVQGKSLGLSTTHLEEAFKTFQSMYKDMYAVGTDEQVQVFSTEAQKFEKTLSDGLKEFEKGMDPFILATTYGFPIELTLELAKEKGQTIDLEDFNAKMAEHQKLSQTSSAGMFKGGLANHNEKTIQLHTAHHLLLAALQQIVSPEIKQRGSNITEERLRMDFSFDRKVTPEELKKVEDLVNEKIQAKLDVVRREMSFADAEKTGAQMEFGAKYPDMVSVYFIGPTSHEASRGSTFSAEFCGGPHVSNTSELGHLKIQKEEASSAGVRRIKAILE